MKETHRLERLKKERNKKCVKGIFDEPVEIGIWTGLDYHDDADCIFKPNLRYFFAGRNRFASEAKIVFSAKTYYEGLVFKSGKSFDSFLKLPPFYKKVGLKDPEEDWHEQVLQESPSSSTRANETIATRFTIEGSFIPLWKPAETTLTIKVGLK